MALQLMAEGDQIEVRDKDLPGVTDGDPEVVYQIRKLTPTVHRKFLKTHTKHEFVRGVGKVEKPDTEAILDDLIDYVLVGWSGVILSDGSQAPCERMLKLSGLDWERKRAIVDKAGANELARAPERRAESFPATS